MSSLTMPPDKVISFMTVGATVPEILEAIRGPLLMRMITEVGVEVQHVLAADPDSPSKFFYPNRMYWCGWSGVDFIRKQTIMQKTYVESKENGLPHLLKHLYTIATPKQKTLVIGYINRIWQTIWTDEYVEVYPSTYVNFCRDPLFKDGQKILFVRAKAIAVEKDRTEERLDKALLTPKHIARKLITNGVGFCWQDYLGNNPMPNPTLGLLSHKERATFVLCQLMLGSRFKGIAVDNEILAIYPDGVLLTGLSKTKKKTKKVSRPLNVSLGKYATPPIEEVVPYLVRMLLECHHITKKIYRDRMAFTDKDKVSTHNVMRKEIRRYIELVFPGMLDEGEGTHMLRKIYLQLAFETYGEGMKETGFAAQVFGHEGYGTSLHYTSVIIT